MGKASPSRGRNNAWSVVVREQEAVLQGLTRGECDGILAAGALWARLEPDSLVQTALDEGFLEWFDDFPDRRERHGIGKHLFCRVLFCGQLIGARSIRPAGRVIFHSASLLDKLGFNFRRVRAAERAPAEAWQPVPLPKRRKGRPLPLRREILGWADQPGWENLGLPIALCLVRDTYADKAGPEPSERVEYWLLVSTAPEQSARAIYELFRLRWGIEENFMALARDHGLNAIHACRDGLALAILHFSLLAYTLRDLCRRVRRAETLPRPKYLVVYWAGCYALLHASQVFEVVFNYWPQWEGRRDEILEALRYCEGG